MSKKNKESSQGFCWGYQFSKPFDFRDKEKNVQMYISYMFARTQSMFEYEGLPETIPARNLELMLQANGNVCIAKSGDDLYAFTGGPGGEPDAYYMPTVYVVANPYLKLNETFKIGENCVVIPSDSLYLGLLPLFSKYATQMAENDLSMNIVDIMARVISFISASDDRTKQSAEKYISDIFAGEVGVIAESAFLDGIRSQPISATSYNAMTPLIEYQQYIKASWLSDIGLNANFNMKREALNSSESALNQDALLPFVDDMLRCRKRGVDAVNAMFGTNISVKLASSWEDNQQEVEAEHESILADAGIETDEAVVDQSVAEPESVEPTDESSDESESVVDAAVELIESAVEEIASKEEEVGSVEAGEDGSS